MREVSRAVTAEPSGRSTHGIETVGDGTRPWSAPSQRGARSVRARLASSELPLSNDSGATFEIHACRGCDDWYVEAGTTGDRRVVLREWHDARCPHFRSLLINELASDG